LKFESQLWASISCDTTGKACKNNVDEVQPRPNQGNNPVHAGNNIYPELVSTSSTTDRRGQHFLCGGKSIFLVQIVSLLISKIVTS